MAVQEKLKLKRSLDNWSTREQLCLASSVLKSGDQNWMSVSRSLKQFMDKDNLKPADWYSPKSCAQQYSQLLENTDAPKRKKREGGETTSESIIVRRLTQERIAELNQILSVQREEYLRLKQEVNLLRSGAIKDDKLQKMWQQIEQEEREQEQRNKVHAAWLAKRQQKKEQLQAPPMASLAVPRKSGDIVAETLDTEAGDDEEKKSKGGRSPLLTSLLKSPSPTTQIVQATTSSAQVTAPTIASLLGSSAKITSQTGQTSSPQLHHLVTSGVASAERPSAGAPTLSMLLEIPSAIPRANVAQPIPTAAPALNPPNYSNVATDNSLLAQTPMVQPVIASNVEGPVVEDMQIPPIANIPVTDSMVQIINQIDNIIPKDIIRNVMDKDEMNEFIGDIEELIKEEITASPQTLDAASHVIDSLAVQNSEMILQGEQALPKTETIYELPIAGISIEEMDSSTSNISDVIGTMATNVIEPKIIVTDESSGALRDAQPEVPSKSVEVADPIAAIIAENIDDITDQSSKSSEVKEDIIEKEESPKTIAESEKSTDTECMAKVTVECIKIEEKKEDEIPASTSDIDIQQEDIKLEFNEESNPDKIDSQTTLEQADVQQTLEQQEIDLEVKADDCMSASVPVNDEKLTEKLEETKETEPIIEKETKVEIQESQTSEVSKETVNFIKKEVEDTTSEEITMKEENPELEEEAQKTSTIETENMKVEETIEENEVVETEEPSIAQEEIKVEQIDTSSVEDKVDVVTENKKDAQINETADNGGDSMTSVPSEEIKKVELEKIEASKSDKEEKVDDKKVVKEPTKDVVKEEPKEIAKVTKKEEERVTKQEEEEKPESEEEEEELKTATDVVKKEKEGVESGEDTGEFYDEEPSISKINAGRAVKTYSKKQVVVDSETDSEGIEGADYRTWKKAVLLVYNRLATHKYASLFLRPITEEHAPGYHSVIFRPMDLSTIKKNIENGTIRSTNQFKRDVMLMFQNALMYNKSNTVVYQMTVTMQEECLEQMQILVQATSEPSFRRETRTAANTSNDSLDIGMKRKRSLVVRSPIETDSPRAKKYKKNEND